jgi:riboflavin kinase/FMN adenylyltransferase
MIAQVSGVVVSGKRLGHKMGFPTVNIDVPGCALPADGVYISEASFHGQKLPCLVNQGYQPTLPSGERRVEAHILDYTGDLYGEIVSLSYVAFLRGERKFESGEELAEQLALDLTAARAWFKL